MTPDQLLVTSGLALGASLWIARRREAAYVDEPIQPELGARGRAYDLLHPMREPLMLGSGKVDFYEQHVGMLAQSGGFKTTLMADVFRQRVARRPVVVLTGGDSDQLEDEVRAAGGYVIRPHDSPFSFNAWEGTPSYCAQGWANLFPTSSDAKVYHSAFEIAAMRYLEDAARPSVQGLRAFVRDYDLAADPLNVAGDGGERLVSGRLWKGMVEGYVGVRLMLMQMAFGDWIGDELSVLDCVKRGVPLMFVCDSADDPDLNRFSAALVWQAINYAVRHRGGFDVIVDELGRLPAHLVGDQVRTWRRNKCHLVVGTHKASDMTDIIMDLIHVWALGAMVGSATDTRNAASDMTYGVVHSTNFGSHVLRQRWTVIDALLRRQREGYFWVVDQERVQQVRVPVWCALPQWKRKRPKSMAHLAAKRAAIGAATAKPHASAFGPGEAATGKPTMTPVPGVGGTEAVAPVDGTGTGASGTETPGGAAVAAVDEAVAFAEPLRGYRSADELRALGLEPPPMPDAYRLEARGVLRSRGDDHLADFWRRHRFPDDWQQPRACWRIAYALKGAKGRKRPGLEYDGRSWQAYDLALALHEIAEQGMDAETAVKYLDYVKLHLSTGTLSADHLCEGWMGVQARLCVRRSHLQWHDKVGNSSLHWQRLKARAGEPIDLKAYRDKREKETTI